MNESDRFRGCLLGLAIGDAIGTTVGFRPRGTFPPLTDLVGKGPFDLKPGEWTDDTSMALCLATSLIEVGGFDPCLEWRRCRYPRRRLWPGGRDILGESGIPVHWLERLVRGEEIGRMADRLRFEVSGFAWRVRHQPEIKGRAINGRNKY